jgi:hypothetical protein
VLRLLEYSAKLLSYYFTHYNEAYISRHSKVYRRNEDYELLMTELEWKLKHAEIVNLVARDC